MRQGALGEATRAVVFDLDGVLYEDARPVPGAARVVHEVQRHVPVRFLTNTTSKSRAGIAAKLAGLGFHLTTEQVFSPGYAAARYLRERGWSASLFVRAAAFEDFDGIRLEDDRPDAVVIGDLAEEWTYERLNQAFRLVLERGAHLVGLGRSLYWRSSKGLLLDVGPFLAALESATGRRALVFGKPERAVFDAVADDLGVPAQTIAMVGDDLLLDVNPAQATGMRGILVRTGKFRQEDLAEGRPPDAILDSVADLIDRSVCS